MVVLRNVKIKLIILRFINTVKISNPELSE